MCQWLTKKLWTLDTLLSCCQNASLPVRQDISIMSVFLKNRNNLLQQNVENVTFHISPSYISNGRICWLIFPSFTVLSMKLPEKVVYVPCMNKNDMLENIFNLIKNCSENLAIFRQRKNRDQDWLLLFSRPFSRSWTCITFCGKWTIFCTKTTLRTVWC